MRADGEPVYRIARQLGVRPRTVYFWAMVWRGIRMETPYEVIAHWTFYLVAEAGRAAGVHLPVRTRYTGQRLWNGPMRSS